jgi:[protein-PII] uridylyltransferase
MGFSPEEILEARTLVSLHLSMYHVATRRDLDDPAAIEEFCRPIPGRETLRDLYLLTVADITTTSPTAMTSWKARMLEELYLAADDHLARTRGQAAEGGERSAQVRALAAQLWTGPEAELSTFLASMPERYLLANGAADIVAHAKVSLARGSLPVHAAIVPSPQREYAELCVVAVAEDRPGLLARIAAVFTAARLEVFAAEVYSRVAKDGRTEAVDLFWVRDRIDGKDGVERRMPSVVSDLLDVCSDKITGKDLILARTGGGSKWSERPSPHVPTEVVVDDRASPRHTVVEVFAKDRPGLLYALAGALHDLGLSIALSKINTEGTRAADVFYVSELDGSKVRPGERFRQIKEAIQRAVAEA